MAVLTDRLSELTEEWDELTENKGSNEYVRYEDGRDNGYFTIKSISKPMLMEEVLKGIQLFKEEREGKVETG